MVLSIKQQQLADDGVSDEVIDVVPQEDDPLLEEQAHGVSVGPASGGSGGGRLGGSEWEKGGGGRRRRWREGVKV